MSKITLPRHWSRDENAPPVTRRDLDLALLRAAQSSVRRATQMARSFGVDGGSADLSAHITEIHGLPVLCLVLEESIERRVEAMVDAEGARALAELLTAYADAREAVETLP